MMFPAEFSLLLQDERLREAERRRSARAHTRPERTTKPHKVRRAVGREPVALGHRILAGAAGGPGGPAVCGGRQA